MKLLPYIIPPILGLIILIWIASSVPAHALCLPSPDPCNDNILEAIPEPSRSATPDIVKVIGAALVIYSIIYVDDGINQIHNVVDVKANKKSFMITLDVPFNLFAPTHRR